LARVAAQGSRLSAVRWATQHAVAERPGMSEAVTSGKVAGTASFSICSRQP
jgi:hypothetical protein